MRLPDFFVVGAPKAATTSLFHALRQLDAFSLHDPKEPGFFCYTTREFITNASATRPEKLPYLVTENAFREAFRGTPPQKLMGDFTTHYLYHAPRFTDQVRRYYGSNAEAIPIIVCLRHPVHRAYSHYMMKVRDRQEDLTFLEAIEAETIRRRLASGFVPTFDYLGFSQYRERIGVLRSAFQQVMIVDYREMTTQPAKVISSVCRFLGVADGSPVDSKLMGHSNRSGAPSPQPFKRAISEFLFTENAVKRWLPMGLKLRLGPILKNSLSPVLLDKVTITKEEEAAATVRLAEEIEFYRSSFPTL